MLQQIYVVVQLLFLRACCGGSFLPWSNSSRMMAFKNRTSCHFVFLSECHKRHKARFVFLPFFSSGYCPHQRNGLILLVWGFTLAVAAQGGPKLCRGSPGQQGCAGPELALQSAAHFPTLLLGGFDLSKDGNISCPQLQEWRQDCSPFPPQSMNDPRSGCRCPHSPSALRAPVHGCQHSHKGKCCIHQLLKIVVRKNKAKQIKSSPHETQPR